MDASEIQKRTIRLGKALVKQLGSEPTADFFSRWMAYYIAEQIAMAKAAKGEAKVKAERQCFQTILKLWEHRSNLPAGMRPFERFDPIFHVLERLDPENEKPYFYQSRDSSTEVNSKVKTDDIQTWLDIAQGIDQAARIWLEYVFHQAAISATDEKTTAWLENAVINGSNRDEISIIVRLIDNEAGNTELNDEQEKKAKQEQLEARIKQLDAFTHFSQVLHTVLATELKTLNLSLPDKIRIEEEKGK